MKSLVEELREFEYNGCTSLASFVHGEDFECSGHWCSACGRETMNALAERIEKEYLPKPLFDDGEPVKVGDTLKTNDGRNFEVSRYAVRSDRYTDFFNEEGSFVYSIRTGERVKRPEPKDSLERIKEDVIKDYEEYWKCVDLADCKYCPSKIDGQTPTERYRTDGCNRAMIFDLIERTAKVMEGK